MRDAQPKSIYLKDYQPPAYLIDETHLKFDLYEEFATELAELEQAHGPDALVHLPEQEIQSLQYPVLQYPTKVSSLNFDKTPEVQGVLQGIKGQYLILDGGVINLRKFTSYHIEFEY